MDLTGGARASTGSWMSISAPTRRWILALVKPGGVIAAYARRPAEMVPRLEFYPFMFKNVRLHMLIVYQLAGGEAARGREAAGGLAGGRRAVACRGAGGRAGKICAAAHDLVAAGREVRDSCAGHLTGPPVLAFAGARHRRDKAGSRTGRMLAMTELRAVTAGSEVPSISVTEMLSGGVTGAQGGGGPSFDGTDRSAALHRRRA